MYKTAITPMDCTMSFIGADTKPSAVSAIEVPTINIKTKNIVDPLIDLPNSIIVNFTPMELD